MDITSAPKLKDTKLKIKKTFAISQDSVDAYIEAKSIGIDATKICVDSIEEAMSRLKQMISGNKNEKT